MKLCQVGCVQCFIPENAVNAEEFGWFEGSCLLVILSNLVEHSCRDCGGVSSQEVLLGLIYFPVVAVPLRSEATHRVDAFDPLQVLLGEIQGLSRLCYEEGVVGVSGRMLLGLKQGSRHGHLSNNIFYKLLTARRGFYGNS